MGNCCGKNFPIPDEDERPSEYPDYLKEDAPRRQSSTVSVGMVHKDVEDFRNMTDYGHVSIFTYDELMLITEDFRSDKILGEGGFGLVYKGTLDESVRLGLDPTPVAVKELNPEGLQGDKEWLAEVNYLGQLSHPNLVKLIGYCCEDENRLLVYEYMAGGSLDKHLFRRASAAMPWSTRLKIALHAAKGLAFLHEATRPIIYRDFKTSNILLDEDMNGKLSDFGLAKEGPTGEQTHVTTRVMGTFGYAAPEYLMTGRLTPRSDVYGFGVVLLELLVGKKAVDKTRPSREQNLVEWVRPLLIHSSRIQKVIDPRMQGQYPRRSLDKVAKLAYDCLSQIPKQRPTMREVVNILEYETERSMRPMNTGTDRDSEHRYQTKARRESSGLSRRTKFSSDRSRSTSDLSGQCKEGSNETQLIGNSSLTSNIEMSCYSDGARLKF